jgi:hypothetical protein
LKRTKRSNVPPASAESNKVDTISGVRDLIALSKQENGEYEVSYYNGIVLGSIYMETGGDYVWDFDRTRAGYWSGHVLRAIADKLEELNAPYELELKEFFEKQENK